MIVSYKTIRVIERRFDLNRDNVKLLQRIVDARQVNFKSRESMISGIKQEESRLRSSRDSSQRADMRKLS